MTNLCYTLYKVSLLIKPMQTILETQKPQLINASPLEILPDDQREVATLYTEAFQLPQSSPDQVDARNEHLETVDALASELLRDITLSGLLRQQAYDAVQEAKARQAALDVKQSQEDQKLTEDPSADVVTGAHVELPGSRPDIVIRAMRKMGYEVVPGGKGSHKKIRSTETGKTTTVPYHKGADISPRLLRDILGQTGIAPEDFKRHL